MVRRLALAALGVMSCGKTSPEPPVVWYERIAPACAAAKAEQRPLLFINWASWDMVSAGLDASLRRDESLRQELRREWIALRVDRTDTYMAEPSGSEQEREVQAARARFNPYPSKYGTIVLVAPDCTTEIGRLESTDPGAMLAQLRAARKRRSL